jgi:aldehyde dehydrogenase (NAD+)
MKLNYIAGNWVQGVDSIKNENPSDTNDIIDEYSFATSEQAQMAIEAAADAAPKWSQSSPLQRFEVLDAIGTEVIARKNELGDLLAREEGKTLNEAVAEVHRAGYLFKLFATEAFRSDSDGYSSIRSGVNLAVKREPLGVIGVITPWNFPMAIPAWKIAPALAYGNTVVFKPAELVPGSAWALAEIISRSGLPEGVFNLVMGTGSVVGQALVDSPLVEGITFTGSTPVGKKIGARVFERGGKIQLEMGGKNPLVISNDADLDMAVNCAIQGSFHSTGQRCTASSRLIVEDSIHDKFVEKMIHAMGCLRIGDARDANTDIGPVASAAQLEINKKYLEIGEKEGARKLIGGEFLKLEKSGFYLSPALFGETSNSMRINQEEIFGPIASIIRVSNFDEAIQVANDIDVGLSAGLITCDYQKIEEFTRRVQAGMVQINLPTAGMDFHAPFTGRKGSSFGPPEKGSYCREFFTQTKVVHQGAMPQIYRGMRDAK